MSEQIICDNGLPCEAISEGKPEKSKKGKKGEERRERTPFEKACFYGAWGFLLLCFFFDWLKPAKEGEILPFYLAGPRAGVKELIKFIYDHLVSAMIPAFFLASAISTFFSKETMIKTMGKNTNPLISYSLAALSGAILTVCSCGVLPIFMSILESGAGLGPAITFLYASPAINLISVIYTWKILPWLLWARIISVFFCAIAIGVIMNRVFSTDDAADNDEKDDGKKSARTPIQEWSFFGLLIIVMLTSTDAMSFLTGSIIPPSVFGEMPIDRAMTLARFWGKIGLLAVEIAVVIGILSAWFTADERRKWIKRTGRQAGEIMPMVFLGVFYSGFFGGAPSMVDYLGVLHDNTILANLLSAFIGSMMYFGSIVGVNIVDLFTRWGMHHGPALALILSGPTISLPSVLAMIPICGKKKSLVYLVLVMVFSAAAGLIYGHFFTIPGR